jgi:hypothetical protein
MKTSEYSKGYFLSLHVVGSTPFYPLIPYVNPFPKHLHRFVRGEASPVPVRPLLKNRQRAVLERSSRRTRNGASKWRKTTLQTCRGELEEHTQIFSTESEALCLLHTRSSTLRVERHVDNITSLGLQG